MGQWGDGDAPPRADQCPEATRVRPGLATGDGGRFRRTRPRVLKTVMRKRVGVPFGRRCGRKCFPSPVAGDPARKIRPHFIRRFGCRSCDFMVSWMLWRECAAIPETFSPLFSNRQFGGSAALVPRPSGVPSPHRHALSEARHRPGPRAYSSSNCHDHAVHGARPVRPVRVTAPWPSEDRWRKGKWGLAPSRRA